MINITKFDPEFYNYSIMTEASRFSYLYLSFDQLQNYVCIQWNNYRPEVVLYPGKIFCILDVVKVCARRVKVKIFDFSFLLISCLKRYILSMAATSDISIRFMYNSLLRTHGLFSIQERISITMPAQAF